MILFLQFLVLMALFIGVPVALFLMIRAIWRRQIELVRDAEMWQATRFYNATTFYDPDYIAAQVAKAAPAFADDEQDDQPVVRKFNKEGANVPPSGLHKPERAADLQAISAEILNISL